jgi:hypothetical protein
VHHRLIRQEALLNGAAANRQVANVLAAAEYDPTKNDGSGLRAYLLERRLYLRPG